MSKHLRVLDEAAPVKVRTDGPRRRDALAPDGLRDLDEWLAPFREIWADRLDAPERHLDETNEEQVMDQEMSDRLGTVLRDGADLALRYERHLAHSPETVWSALTESAGLRHWFPADIVGERATGATVQLPFWPEGAEASMEALEQAGVDTAATDPHEVLPGLIRTFDPPRLFELIWGNPAGPADVLRFELGPDEGGTRLVFTTWPGEPGPLGHAGTAAGWHACLDGLESLVDTGTAEEPDRSAILELQEHYATQLS